MKRYSEVICNVIYIVNFFLFDHRKIVNFFWFDHEKNHEFFLFDHEFFLFDQIFPLMLEMLNSIKNCKHCLYLKIEVNFGI